MSIVSLAAPLSPEWYWQPEYLERERAQIFRENWIFAGFTDDVARDNDYISFSIAGLPVVIRNMKGRLVAFRNVCSHRHSLIHPPGCGNGMFRCLFHGWTYNVEGVPIGIPDNDRSFGFSKADKCALALEPLMLEKCGRFLFVRSSKKGPSLKDFLGSLYEKLEHISATFEKNYATLELDWKCNWKIGLEITLEGYHLPMIHPISFTEHISGAAEIGEIAPANEDAPPPAPVDVEKPENNDDYGHNEYIGPHSLNSAPLSQNSLTHLTTVANRLKLKRSDSMTGYEHFLIYPNVMIGVNGGTNVCVERYEPVSASETKVECWLMTGAPADGKLYEGIIWQTIMKQWQDWTTSVMAEDQRGCEAAQLGVQFADHRALLGRAEARVRHFQNAIFGQAVRDRKAA